MHCVVLVGLCQYHLLSNQEVMVKGPERHYGALNLPWDGRAMEWIEQLLRWQSVLLDHYAG
jgi:hypothetical protein